MRVRDWMTPSPVAVRPKDKLSEAARLLASCRVNQLPVVTGNRVVGMLAERDVRDVLDAYERLFGARAGERRKPELTVEAAMTPYVVAVHPDDDLREAARRLREQRLSALPVIEGEQLVGILARADLVAALVEVLSVETESPKPVAVRRRPTWLLGCSG